MTNPLWEKRAKQLEAENDRLKIVPVSDPNPEYVRAFLDWRGVKDPCTKCNGVGNLVWTCSESWRAEFGDGKQTRDVCDVCWGTGDSVRRGYDLRAVEATHRAELDENATWHLAERAGCSKMYAHKEIESIIKTLERMKHSQSAAALAEVLRAGIARREAGGKDV